MILLPNKQEILRYLGHRGQEIDRQTAALLDECIETMATSIKPRFCYRLFRIEHNDNILLPECNLSLSGRDITNHLKDCQKCILLAVTLGIEADNLIRVAEAESMTRALILDACATELTEKLCEHAEAELSKLAKSEGGFLTSRFSPGYGDFPIGLQNRIGEVLDTQRKIGLTITEQSLMIPRKSVTAVIGLTQSPCSATSNQNCTTCTLQGRCQFQKEINSYGN